MGDVLTMRRAPDPVTTPPDLDPVQAEAARSDARALLVVGGPGSGKTVTAVETVVQAVAGGLRPDQCLLLSPTRLSAGVLRGRVTSRLGGTFQEPVARTPQSLGFGLLRQAAALDGRPAPRLLNGPEQDVVLKELLAGYHEGDAPAPPWPEEIVEAIPTRGFRGELRDLLMRAVEWGVDAPELRRLAEVHERPEWVAAAQVLDDYDQVTAMSRPGAYDPAWVLSAAADLLEDDPFALERARAHLRLLVVDDAQELTHAGARLLRLLAGPGTRLRLVCDPDATVQGFRGADPRLALRLAHEVGAPEALVLPHSYRQPQVLRTVAERVSSRIGVVGPAARRELTTRTGGDVSVALLRSVAQEATFVGGLLRRAHLKEGVGWADMAVVVRGHGRSSALRRALAAAGVPVAVPAAQVPLRDEPAVRPLLDAMAVSLGLAAGTGADGDLVDAGLAVDLLTSVVGGADAVSLRRLRRALRRAELEAGGARTSDELVSEAVQRPAVLTLLGPEATAARRVAGMIDAGRRAALEGGATAETVLWAMWEATGLAIPWQEAALEGGVAGARADRDLDAVVALFGAAAAYVDRLPQLGPASFLEHVLGQDVPGDSLVERSPSDDCVALVTPAAAAGREWHTVVVAGVQEGVWPDLRLRGSLLGSEHLVDVLSGRHGSLRAAQAAVRYDETRQLLVAVSRARERLVVTAVRSEDEQPSVYLDLVDPAGAESGEDDGRAFTDVEDPLTLPAVVAGLRRELGGGRPEREAERQAAARRLARLAAEAVPGAHPDQWWALTDLSDDRPLREPGQLVGVSPSKVDGFGRCGLNWLLQACGGSGGDIGSASLGTLVHEIAAELGDTEPERMSEVLHERWARLGLGDTWVSARQQALADDMITRLARYLADARAEGWELVEAERQLTLVVGRARLNGRVDRLERHPEHGLRVIDLKTGSSHVKETDLEYHPQLGAYQVAIVEGGFPEGRESHGAALVQVGTGGFTGKNMRHRLQQQPPVDGPDSWAHELVQATADGMAAATVTAREGDLCQVCPVQGCCPLRPEGETL